MMYAQRLRSELTRINSKPRRLNVATQQFELDLVSSLLSDESYWPTEPQTLAETGLTSSFIDGLIAKLLLTVGSTSGRSIAEQICVPFRILEETYASLRARQYLVHAGSAPFNDYYYSLTDNGRKFAAGQMEACAYIGPAPVPLVDYVVSVEAQAIAGEAIGIDVLSEAFENISVDEELIDVLGPAVNSNAGMFLYGSPGNGKSTIAGCLTKCFGQNIWIPHATIDDGQIIKIFDASYHAEVDEQGSSIFSKEYDRRWLRVKRPTVVVGGEMTMDSLEIRHSPRSNVCEAPIQMKSNGGCLLVDDFGRQRVAPSELLNRWIIPLENRIDFLTLPTGKKIQIPFEQLIIFSTNLDPSQLVDEAFLRRIPYKIEVEDPGPQEFHQLFVIACEQIGCVYQSDVVDWLIEKHYKLANRPMRRCHPRDLLKQIRNYCVYKGCDFEMLPEYFDLVISSYFANTDADIPLSVGPALCEELS